MPQIHYTDSEGAVHVARVRNGSLEKARLMMEDLRNAGYQNIEYKEADILDCRNPYKQVELEEEYPGFVHVVE